MNDDFDKEWEEKLMTYATELHVDKAPSPLLEERTVRELRSRGLLRRKRMIPMPWLAGSIAASLALFATGVVVGQYVGTRSTLQLFTRTDAAMQVQQTGTAYVQALEKLAKSGDNARAREVALTALHEAANQVVRIAPNDPVTAKILQGIEQEQKQTDKRAGKSSQRNVVWF